MKHTRTITREAYGIAMRRYWVIVNTFPIELQETFSHFENFVTAASWAGCTQYDLELSSTGMKRFEMLLGPHAATLLRAWAIQRLPVNDNQEVIQE